MKAWGASSLAGIKHHNSVPTDRGQDLKPEANEPTKDRETVNELIRLTDKLLSRYESSARETIGMQLRTSHLRNARSKNVSRSRRC
jgi:hypothetical protein